MQNSWLIMGQTVLPIQQKGDELFYKVTQQNTLPSNTKVQLLYTLGLKYAINDSNYWGKALQLAKVNQQPFYTSVILEQLYKIHYTLNNDSTALQLNNSAIKISENYGYDSLLMVQLLQLVNYYKIGSNQQKVLETSFKGLKIAEQRKDMQAMAHFYSEIGNCYFSLKSIDNALNMHFKCLTLYRFNKDTLGIIGSLLDIGSSYLVKKDTVKCAAYYLGAASYFNAVKERIYAVHICNALGNTALFEKNYSKALDYYEKGYTIALKNKSKRGIASVLASKSGVLLAMKNYKLSIATAKVAIRICDSIHFETQKPYLFELIYKSYMGLNDYKNALVYFQAGIVIKDSLTNKRNLKHALEKEFNYHLDKKENENRFLEQKMENQSLNLRQTRYLVVILFIFISLGILFVYLVFRQNKLKTGLQRMELEQHVLRSQMNPHFIFNSLQAIQSFILKQESKTAVKFLSLFSNIIRHVLQNSRKESIPLEEELEMLDNYLHLQKIRFGNRFSYGITTDAILLNSSIRIPPMLLQPFIENAVEHGMKGTFSDGFIEVNYRLVDNCLLAEVKDNGVGIELNLNKKQKHQSMAINITRNRIELWQSKIKKNILFKIDEAFPAHPERKGVKISIGLPLELHL